MLGPGPKAGNAYIRIETPQARRRRWLATTAVLLIIPLPILGLVLPAIDRVREARDRAT